MRIVVQLDPSTALIAFVDSPEEMGDIVAALGQMSLVKKNDAGQFEPPGPEGFHVVLEQTSFLSPSDPAFALIEEWAKRRSPIRKILDSFGGSDGEELQ